MKVIPLLKGKQKLIFSVLLFKLIKRYSTFFLRTLACNLSGCLKCFASPLQDSEVNYFDCKQFKLKQL